MKNIIEELTEYLESLGLYGLGSIRKDQLDQLYRISVRIDEANMIELSQQVKSFYKLLLQSQHSQENSDQYIESYYTLLSWVYIFKSMD